ncbi:MAG: glycosyltransferase [Alphaproteobacteria bacterium]
MASADVETLVVGHVPAALASKLARPGLRFLGEQTDLAPFLADARLGLVAEEMGGGFKIKTLDYIFHGLPIAALTGSLTGLPSDVQQHTLQASSPQALARAVLGQIDGLDGLNHMQDAALAAARPAFDWASRGTQLKQALGQVIVERGLRYMGGSR